MITETAISLSTRRHGRILKSGHFSFLLTGVSPAAGYVYDLSGDRQRRDLVDAFWQEGYAYAEGSSRVALVEGVERTDEALESCSHRLRMEYNDTGLLWRLYENDELAAQ